MSASESPRVCEDEPAQGEVMSPWRRAGLIASAALLIILCLYGAVPGVLAWRRGDTFLATLILHDPRGVPRLVLLFRPPTVIVDQTDGTLRVDSEFLPTGELRVVTPGPGRGDVSSHPIGDLAVPTTPHPHPPAPPQPHRSRGAGPRKGAGTCSR